MPCRDWDYVQRERDLRSDKIDKLTRMLCWLCGKTYPSTLRQNQELRQWWADHQEKDRIRREAERKEASHRRLRLKALARLTNEERDALGL